MIPRATAANPVARATPVIPGASRRWLPVCCRAAIRVWPEPDAKLDFAAGAADLLAILALPRPTLPAGAPDQRSEAIPVYPLVSTRGPVPRRVELPQVLRGDHGEALASGMPRQIDCYCVPSRQARGWHFPTDPTATQISEPGQRKQPLVAHHRGWRSDNMRQQPDNPQSLPDIVRADIQDHPDRVARGEESASGLALRSSSPAAWPAAPNAGGCPGATARDGPPAHKHPAPASIRGPIVPAAPLAHHSERGRHCPGAQTRDTAARHAWLDRAGRR